MLGVGALALAANLICLALLRRFRKQDINMSSTFECSRNDDRQYRRARCGRRVALFAPSWPDIVIGLVIAALFLRSAHRVIAEAGPRSCVANQWPPKQAFLVLDIAGTVITPPRPNAD